MGSPTKEPTIFLDCDGVLADFDKAGELLWGEPPRQYEQRVGEEQFWHEVEHAVDFFGTLPLIEDAVHLAEGCERLTGRLPVILTGCPRGDWAKLQKLDWAAKFFPRLRIITCESRCKRDFGRPGDVLIDDWPKYKHLWEEMGGYFILHQSARHSLEQLAALLDAFKQKR
jgi:hypothetical protein